MYSEYEEYRRRYEDAESARLRVRELNNQKADAQSRLSHANDAYQSFKNQLNDLDNIIRLCDKYLNEEYLTDYKTTMKVWSEFSNSFISDGQNTSIAVEYENSLTLINNRISDVKIILTRKRESIASMEAGAYSEVKQFTNELTQLDRQLRGYQDESYYRRQMANYEDLMEHSRR